MEENENTSYVHILDSTSILAKDLNFHFHLEKLCIQLIYNQLSTKATKIYSVLC